jgi:hypothetical protein
VKCGRGLSGSVWEEAGKDVGWAAEGFTYVFGAVRLVAGWNIREKNPSVACPVDQERLIVAACFCDSSILICRRWSAWALASAGVLEERLELSTAASCLVGRRGVGNGAAFSMEIGFYRMNAGFFQSILLRGADGWVGDAG